MAALRRVADDLRPISAAVYAHRPLGPSVAIVAANVNSAFMAVLVDALGWLDTTITQRFVEGFPIVGEVTDSGVYRRIRRPRADPEEHAEKLSSFRDTAGEWNANLMRGLARGSGDEADAAVASRGGCEGAWPAAGAAANLTVVPSNAKPSVGVDVPALGFCKTPSIISNTCCAEVGALLKVKFVVVPSNAGLSVDIKKLPILCVSSNALVPPL